MAKLAATLAPRLERISSEVAERSISNWPTPWPISGHDPLPQRMERRTALTPRRENPPQNAWQAVAPVSAIRSGASAARHQLARTTAGL